jgi:1-acyl-sn-glycerol-3-phosphate acyltransferase
MGTYIMLSRLTDEGRRTLKERPERLQEVNEEILRMGARVTRQFALLGEYDFINVIEAPDNQTITNISVDLSSRGTIQLKTLAAVPAGTTSQRHLLDVVRQLSTFVVFTKLTGEGRKSVHRDPDRLSVVDAEIGKMGARVLQHYRVLGDDHDFVTFAEAPDNETAARISTEISSLGTVRLEVHPAIPLDRFTALLQIKSYRTEPHAWQTQPWARAARKAGRHWVMTRHVQEIAEPMTTTGAHVLRDVRGPALIIANHTSHFDTPVVLTALPGQLRDRTAVAAAADRFYRTSKKRTWWWSLFWNTFPIHRGGGSKALAYPMELLKNGWSILIYPEGGRAKTGRIKRFHHGPTIMAMQGKVPVIPVFLEGLEAIMPRGSTTPTPGPVNVRLGAPISLEGVESVLEGTARLEAAMRELGGLNVQSAAAY